MNYTVYVPPSTVIQISTRIQLFFSVRINKHPENFLFKININGLNSLQPFLTKCVFSRLLPTHLCFLIPIFASPTQSSLSYQCHMCPSPFPFLSPFPYPQLSFGLLFSFLVFIKIDTQVHICRRKIACVFCFHVCIP